MDAFFASVEQHDNPAFRGKPLIVGGSPGGRGVVAACSYEARQYGVHSAMPSAKAVKLCPSAIFTRPRMERYREVSASIMDLFQKYTHLVEPLSLDEAFLDVTQNFQDQSSATILAQNILQEICTTTGLTASAGISFNKFLAKVASDFNKPNGLTTVSPEHATSFLEKLPIGKFFGVGKVTEKKMLSLGIKTGLELRKWDKESLVFHFGKSGTFLYNIVRGIDDRPVEPQRIRKSVGREITLENDTDDLLEINERLHDIAAKLENSLFLKKTGGHTLTLKVRYHNFTTISRSLTVSYPISTKNEILSLIPRLLGSTQAGTIKIRLLGLSISKLTGEQKGPRQLRLPFM